MGERGKRLCPSRAMPGLHRKASQQNDITGGAIPGSACVTRWYLPVFHQSSWRTVGSWASQHRGLLTASMGGDEGIPRAVARSLEARQHVHAHQPAPPHHRCRADPLLGWSWFFAGVGRWYSSNSRSCASARWESRHLFEHRSSQQAITPTALEDELRSSAAGSALVRKPKG